jgi:hypothetical protein
MVILGVIIFKHQILNSKIIKIRSMILSKKFFFIRELNMIKMKVIYVINQSQKKIIVSNNQKVLVIIRKN